MTGQYYYGVGRRKTSTAQVRLYPGDGGTVIVNGKPVEEYFGRLRDLRCVAEPFQVTATEGNFTVTVVVKGGGVTGQAEAVRHGIARALLKYNPELRPTLRKAGFLTRDPREHERKKPGQPGRRRQKQYTKR
jgi:small subunit ribosomal protein S9